jgi:nucleotide-binding universal stress UspA family protein
MAKPIIAAVDPRREDVAPAALGALLARLTGAPLMLAAAYPVDASADNLYPDYARALAVHAEQALRRVAAMADDAGVPVTTTVLPAAASPAQAFHELAESAKGSCSSSVPRGADGSGACSRALSPIACCTVLPARWQ